jgi:antitoxin CptB|tara:strand:+ start:415 stop:678 length:264 start_codon:yes stop_codon:yes gene_type:complete
MTYNINDLKKRIIYRSMYRGTKEMDGLLSTFTKIYLETFSNQELILLSNLLDLDDENLYKFKQGKKTSIDINDNKISRLFKDFKYNE